MLYFDHLHVTHPYHSLSLSYRCGDFSMSHVSPLVEVKSDQGSVASPLAFSSTWLGMLTSQNDMQRFHVPWLTRLTLYTYHDNGIVGRET
jgi:hypothetical protein